jgi:hypothetical protein
MRISAPPAARPILGSRAVRGPEELRDSEWTYTSTHAHLGTAGRGTRKGVSSCTVNMTWEAKARARHRLESSLSGSRDSDGDGVSPVVDGFGPM